ncbi:unnamed protein product, partial [Mesorhabditis spiculigera]
MSARLITTVLLCTVSVFGLETIKFRPCKSTFTVDRVAVKGAQVTEEDGKQVLIFKPDTKPLMHIEFTPTIDTSAKYLTSVNAKGKDGLLKWTLPQPESCEFMECPLEKGKQVTYEQEFHLKAQYPKGHNMQVNWALEREGQNEKDVCIIFLAKILEA